MLIYSLCLFASMIARCKRDECVLLPSQSACQYAASINRRFEDAN